MRALITGVTGQDGYYLAHHLHDQGDEVFGLVQPSPNPGLGSEMDYLRRELPFVTPLMGDLQDAGSLFHILREVEFDEVYHLAALSIPAAGDATPELMMQVTALGTLRLLEAIQGVPLPARFLLAGSDDAFGPQPPPQSEETPLRPVTVYGVAKATAMHLVRVYREKYGLFACNAVLFNHTSPRQSETFLLPKIARAAARIAAARGFPSEPLQLGDLNARRDWSFAGDVVKAMPLILRQSEPGDYMVGGGQSHAVKEACELAFGLLGLDWRVHVRGSYEGPEDVAYSQANTRKIRELGWQPGYDLQGLMKMLVEKALEDRSVNRKMSHA